MKTGSIRIALFAAVLLASPALTFAGGQPKLHAVGKTAMPDRTSVSPAVNQGKGAGISRKQVVVPANTSQTAPRPAVGTAFSK